MAPEELLDRMAGLVERLSLSMERHESLVIEGGPLSALTPTQIHVLDLIGHTANPTVSDLSRKLQVSKPSVTVLVDRLASRGYVGKRRSALDRRSFILELTPRGRRITSLHDRIHRGYADLLVRALSGEELTRLAGLLEKALDRMGQP